MLRRLTCGGQGSGQEGLTTHGALRVGCWGNTSHAPDRGIPKSHQVLTSLEGAVDIA